MNKNEKEYDLFLDDWNNIWFLIDASELFPRRLSF